MATYERKPGEFILFKNNKQKDNQPDWKGEGLGFDGVPFDIAGWVKQGKSEFITGRISQKFEKKEPPKDATPPKSYPENDDLPF